MKKNFIRDNSNFSPSIHNLRTRRIFSSSAASSTTSSTSTSSTASSTSSASSNECSTSSTASSTSSDLTASSNAHSTIESLIHFTSFSEQEDGEEVEEEFDLLNRLNNLNITATDQWTLVKTNRNKPKLASMGFYYTQACTLKKTGEIKWKCELTKTCPAIGFSPGMSGPFDLRTEHKHQANPERLNILINNQKIKEKAMCSNDQPRSIMINANKHFLCVAFL